VRLLASGSFAEVYKVKIKGKELAAKVYYELSWDERLEHAQQEYVPGGGV